MAKLPTVAIIGKPNTGKSTLFNRLIGSRKAIESAIPGTTRDLISHRVDDQEIPYLLLDTGGIGVTNDIDFEANVREQSKLALEHADIILFTINAAQPPTIEDHKIVDLLRRSRKRHVPVIVVLTKVDNPKTRGDILANYQEMNVGDAMITLSAPHRLGIDDLNRMLMKTLRDLHFVREEKLQTDAVPAPRIAIIGRPNVGKSSIVNALMSDTQREKMPLLVSPVAGTTRDSTDTEILFHERKYILVDTAGLKKRSQTMEEIERFSMMRTIQAMEQCDVVVLVLDALQTVSQQDKRIAAMAVESGKGLVIFANKIEGIKGEARKEKIHEISLHLMFCKFAPIVPCSAITREGLVKIFDIVETVQRSRMRRLSAKDLRRWFEQVVHGQPLGEVGKCKHLTQADEIPPTFVLFVKDERRVRVTQLRYLENRLRETFSFDGVPIRWITKSTPKKATKMVVK